MMDQNETSTKKGQMRYMWENAQKRVVWIGVAVILLIFLLYTGLRLTHTDKDMLSSPTVEGR